MKGQREVRYAMQASGCCDAHSGLCCTTVYLPIRRTYPGSNCTPI